MKRTILGTLIKSYREQNHLTQAAFAKKLDVTDKAVSKWERGLSYPDVSLLPRLANVLGVTADDLLAEYADEGQPSGLIRIFEMSHDIRTPLHMILGCADMAETYYEDRDLLMRYLESIRISGEYLLHVLNQAMENSPAGTASDIGSAGRDSDIRYAAANPESGRKSVQNIRKRPADLKELGEYLKNPVTPMNEKKKAEAKEYDFSGKRILVAEDMELNREIAQEILKRTGAEIEFAEDGRICVEMIENAPAGYYDLVLMDILMPNLDGIQATSQIRALADPMKASIPIIAMTANVSERDRKAAFRVGMNAFTEKPVLTGKLFETIGRFL